VTTDLNTLLTALYVKIDDEIGGRRWLGRPPVLTDSELVCLAVAQALLGCRSEAQWLRFARAHLAGMFPYLPQRPGYNRRLRAALPLIKRVIRLLAADTDFWLDNVWIADSTPVECARSRPAVKRSAMAGWASYGYCPSHSRWFWGLRLYLIATPAGMPITWALANPKLDERKVLAAMLEAEPELAAARPGLVLIADKGFKARWFETSLARQGSSCCAPRCATSGHGQASSSSNRYASSSNRSTTPSKASPAWNNTAAGPSRASPSESPSASWR
jgi:hypothetical protein